MKKQWIIKPLIWVSLILMISVTDLSAGPRNHDGGFFLRLSAGLGTARTKFGNPAIPMEISGFAGDVNIAIGGVVSPNLAVHGTIFGWSAIDPNVELDGASGEIEGNVIVSTIGGGVTYYFMPINLYVSGSAGFAKLSLETTEGVGETDYGPALEITLGKEWWVGNSWGLGVAGDVGYHSVPEKNIDENWSGLNLAVRFTATLN